MGLVGFVKETELNSSYETIDLLLDNGLKWLFGCIWHDLEVSMDRLWGTMIGIGMMLTALRAEGPIFPDCSIAGSIAPYVDKDGYVNPIIPLDAASFGKELTLPIELNFSSKIRPPSSEFGQGWECPLFDARIFDVQKDLKKVELLGGREIYLVYNQRTDSWRHFFTNAWKGVAKGDKFELTYKTGCTLVFNKGLISSLTTPDGRTILWNRSGDKLISMQETGKPPAVQIIYDQLGFAKQILLKPNHLGVAKRAYDFEANLVNAGIDKIQGPDKRIITFNSTRDKYLNPVITLTDTLHPPLTASWNIKSGKILSDDKYLYSITEVSDKETWPKIARKNITTGKMESYYFDQKHGTLDETLADGTIRHIEMIQSPGPNFKAVRLIQDTKNGKTQVVFRRSFDDRGHLLLEAVGLANGTEAVKQYAYDEAGRVVSYIWNGKEMWKNVYDATSGQLKERDLTELGVKMTFDQKTGGDVVESVVNPAGVVTSTKTLNANQWQSSVSSMQRLE